MQRLAACDAPRRYLWTAAQEGDVVNMLRTGVLVAVAVLCGCGGWTKRDTALEFAAQATFAGDWHQTQSCVDVAPHCYEQNPIMGDSGQRLAPVTYFVGVGILHVAIAAVLPHGWLRTTFQAVTIGAELKQIHDNVGELDKLPALARTTR